MKFPAIFGSPILRYFAKDQIQGHPWRLAALGCPCFCSLLTTRHFRPVVAASHAQCHNSSLREARTSVTQATGYKLALSHSEGSRSTSSQSERPYGTEG